MFHSLFKKLLNTHNPLKMNIYLEMEIKKEKTLSNFL